VSDELAALAADAYVYGFPLIFDLQMVGGQAEMGMIKPATWPGRWPPGACGGTTGTRRPTR
jgi:hypothetical protein